MRAGIACVLCVTLSTALAAAADAPVVDLERLSDNIRILSSDAFEGRAPATPGEKKTVDFLIDRFRKAGFEPGAGEGSWTQPVALRRIQVAGPMMMSVRADGASAQLVQGEDVAVATRQTEAVAVEEAPVVFVGYGVHAPERDWDDFKGVDLKGKIAMVLINDPDFEVASGGRFDGKAMTYYGRWTYKYEELARRGAVGALIVHETEPASYGWNTVKNSFTGPQYVIAGGTGQYLPIEAWITLDRAGELLKRSGQSFAELKAAAQRPDFRPVPLEGMTISSAFEVEVDDVMSHNVIALLPGTERPDETILYTAHWDHLGRGTGEEGDQIFNGAVDNATGTAGLIELAHAFKAAPPPARSIVLLAVTAEEQGLLGSEYYAAHPVYPLAKTVALLNMDTLSVFGPARNMEVIGYGKSELEDILREVAAAEKIEIVQESKPEAGYFYRSDHFSLAKHGVPALYLSLGLDLVDGGVAAGRKASDHYTEALYHQPGDEWSADWDLGGAAQELRILFEVGRRLATSNDWPEWKPGAEFKAARDETAAERR